GGIATDGVSHYVSRAGSAGWLIRVPFAGGVGPFPNVATPGGYITFTALDDRYVYFAGAPAGVGRVAKSGGTVQYFVPSGATGTASCDGDGANGCEAALDHDPGNCGACGTSCPSGFCVAGGCVPLPARRSCLAHQNAGVTEDGYYLVDPDDVGPAPAVPVRC